MNARIEARFAVLRSHHQQRGTPAAKLTTATARSAEGGGLTGMLRLTSVPRFGEAVLAPLLARFQTLHLELRSEVRLTHRRIDLVRGDARERAGAGAPRARGAGRGPRRGSASARLQTACSKGTRCAGLWVPHQAAARARPIRIFCTSLVPS